MKTKYLISSAFVILLLLSCNSSFSQSTTATNAFAPGRFLGYNNAGNLDFRTAGILRMHMNGNITNNVNNQGNLARNGFVGLGLDLGGLWSNPAQPGPFSLLHLNGPGTFVQQGGYRNWMQTGITFTSK